MAIYGARMKLQRDKIGKDVKEVALRLGKSYQYVWKLEEGINDPPTWRLLSDLARLYNCSTDYLLGLTEDPTPAVREEPVAHVPELISVSQQLSEVRRLELLRIAEALYELEQEAAAAQPTLLEETLERLKHGDTPRVIGAQST